MESALPAVWEHARYTELLTGPPETTSLPGMSVEFLLTSLVVILIPGTGVIYTLSSSIGGGRLRGLFAAIGCALGIVPHMLAARPGRPASRWSDARGQPTSFLWACR